ncbi:sugar-binding transcriptional regulator [Pseudohoeflea coraliihabitans]|uniref:Sugar-binding domain-containing protein n=1 Tax=Pseudohoeflea coraliihabitans TaxID=2860393 RepID=A0ABS6WJ66_9HYPH|nr:sugar-binding domain-containing protein [Pseudohoeflea sp. DP4N28-3]MBW3095993.1 hypothetical protein [Pseudohoeflea sp. DP4N28-3]
MRNVSKSEQRRAKRQVLLADVAEMYFIKQMTQGAIAKKISTTPSNVSRMISDCQRLGIVRITINRPRVEDDTLSSELAERFKLVDARVVVSDEHDPGQISRTVAAAGAEMLKDNLVVSGTLGITWGRTLLSIIEEFGEPVNNGGTVVQLAGSIGATHEEFDAVSLVHRLADLLHARPAYLSAPFFVDDPAVAASLLKNSSNLEARRSSLQCDVVIIGVGNLDPQHSTLLNSGHLSEAERQHILDGPGVAEICGHPITVDGQLASPDFSKRIISIRPEEILSAKTRIAIAARPNIVQPTLAALHGGYVTHLVANVETANALLAED